MPTTSMPCPAAATPPPLDRVGRAVDSWPHPLPRKDPLASDDALRERAERRFQQARERAGAKDPRDFYRERLRELRERDESAYRRAVDYFERTLVPNVARDDSDPLHEWLEYGRLLAELTAPGETVRIDPTGLSTPYAPPVAADDLVLHLPASTREPALPIGLPPRLSPAQRAAYDLLVKQSVG